MLNRNVCKAFSLVTLLLLSAAMTGCSGEPGSDGRTDGDKPSPANGDDDNRRAGAEDAEEGSGKEGASDEAKEEPATTASFVTNTPDAKFKVKGAGGMKLRLTSSNLVAGGKLGDRLYHQWFAEVRNDGDAPACMVSVEVLAKGANGKAVSNVAAYLVAEPYAVGSTDGQSAACIPPEGHGILWGNYLGPLIFTANAIDTVELRYSGIEFEEAVPHASTPLLSSATLGTKLERRTVAATATALTTLSDLGIEIFGLRADGLIVDRTTVRHLEPLAKGLSWAYEATFRNNAEGVERVVQHPSLTPASHESALHVGLTTMTAPLASTTFSHVARAVQARASEVEARR